MSEEHAIPTSAIARSAALAAATRALLDSLRRVELEPYLADWPIPAAARAVTPHTLPALRWLPQIRAGAPSAARAVSEALGDCAARLSWRQTYPDDRVKREFLDHYAWVELLGSTGELDSSRLGAGFLILGPHTRYPPHAHRAEEIYLPISGTAAWWKSSAPWRDVPPLTLVQHAANEAHAMRTAAEPLLALYLWHGAGLDEKAHLVDANM